MKDKLAKRRRFLVHNALANRHAIVTMFISLGRVSIVIIQFKLVQI